MKLKLFEDALAEELEHKVNRWLHQEPKAEVIKSETSVSLAIGPGGVAHFITMAVWYKLPSN
jgi:hypothetical protein